MTVFGLGDLAFLGAVGTPTGPTDPLFANVSLLLHGDGANGSTTIIDSSPSPKTVTAVGNAQISTAQSRFGAASIAFDGSGDRIDVGNASNWSFLHNNAKSWTIELWHRRSSLAGIRAILETASRSSNIGLTLYSTEAIAGDLICYVTRGANGSIFAAQTSQAVLQANTWQHIAIDFQHGATAALSIYVNGSLVAANTTSSFAFSSNNPTNTLSLGKLDAGGAASDFNGFLDEIRITEGVARYQGASFTPPTAPFPDA